MSELNLWLGLEKIVINPQTLDFVDDIVKVCCCNTNIFILTKDNLVYFGSVEHKQGSAPFLQFTKSNIKATDISTNSTNLYFIDVSGRVYKTTPLNLNEWEEVILKENSKCCVHGYKTPAHDVKVKAIAVSEIGCLYVTDSGQLWASGDHVQLNIQGDEPKPVFFFENRCVKAVSCGSDFNLVLVQKLTYNLNEKDDTDDENDISDVFVSSCPTCVNEYVSSPVSQPSTSDTCPLGLHINHISAHNSSTSTSKDNSADDRKSSDESSSFSVREKSVFEDTLLSSKNTQDNVNEKLGEVISENGDTEHKKKISFEEDETKTNTELESDKENEDVKCERKNEFFINTDAARQFLTRQLSWVSSYGGAGEDLLVECAEASLVRPSRIIKQNVSNMANLVYEGVKTVGDRVVTLSRHMSGGSETSECVPGGLTDFGSFEDLSNEDPKSSNIICSVRCEELITSSPGASDRGDESETGIDERISTLVQTGTSVLAVELWAWGNVYHGQIGTGENMKKNRPCIVSRLSGIGVYHITCGQSHAAAVTIDGRAFAWGKNNSCQVTLESTFDQSSPQHITNLPNSERVRDVAAGSCHTLIQSNEGSIYYLGKQDNVGPEPGVFVQLEINKLYEEKVAQKIIFASRKISGCLVMKKSVPLIVQHLSTEQSFLEEVILVQNCLIKAIQKKGGAVQENTVYSSLCTCYSDLLGLTTLNVQSLWECAEYGTDATNVTMVLHVEEHVRMYRNYLNVLCDVISITGFVHIAKLVEIPPKLVNFFSERSLSKKNRKAPEAIVSSALSSPLNRLNVYRCMVQSLLKNNASLDIPLEVKQESERKFHNALAKWDQIWDEQEKRKREADATRQFWESSGRLMELLRSPNRRLIRESRSHPISVVNSGRFTSHWLVLLSDVLVHVVGSSQTVHSLSTIWVEAIQDTDTLQNVIMLIMPEETLTLFTPTPNDKKEWLQCLQLSIKKNLHKLNSIQPPAIRTATYSFTKHVLYKDAKYTGRWCNGKLQGAGKMVWLDGRVYIGQFQNNLMHGYGCLETPEISTYEGQWKEGQQNGLGIIKYASGDVYEGYFKDGLAHGHGVRKQGHFTASVASVYIGEWVAGVKQGYGVMDDIVTGEKYLGCWSNNMKHGCGLIVTLDGIYYEGVFMQDVLTGHGVMVFEDGTHYEGEFKAAGVFNGKGTLTFNSGDRLEGSLHGAWNEGVKVTGTLHKSTSAPTSQLLSKPQSFGKLCVAAHQKWKAIFRQCYQQLGVGDMCLKSSPNNSKSSYDVQKLWENIAVLINNSRQDNLQGRGNASKNQLVGDSLDTIPQFGIDKLDKETHQELRKYLSKAFESTHHPLGELLTEVTTAYTATYGGVRVHPLLLNHAVEELHSITGRVYEVVRTLFPALPPLGQELLLGGQEEQEKWCLSDSEVVSSAALLHPVILPRVHSALFVLYALHNKQEDDAYWKRLLKWNKQPDSTLMAFLGIDQKFWIKYSSPKNIGHNIEPPVTFSPLKEQLFRDAVETLQQLKTTFSPLEKLLVIRNTFEQMTRAVQQELGTDYLWSMDDLFPVFHFVVVRSQILQLGSEIHFIEDFMEPYLQNGELGIMFTTLKACYYQILQEKVSMSS